MKRSENYGWFKDEFEKIHDQIKNKDGLSLYDFLRIRNYKLQNFTMESESHVIDVTHAAFNLASQGKTMEALRRLLKLDGVRIPIASAILAMKYPERYAIIDKNVIKELGKGEWLDKYLTDVTIYEKYLELMREGAKKKNMSLRDYERRLFERKKG